MKYINIGKLSLKIFDKNNEDDLIFLKKLCKDTTISNRFQGIMLGLTNNRKEFFNHSFFVTDNNLLVGYINIGNYNTIENCVYLRAAIDIEKRGKGYGKLLLSEITEYIFNNYPQIESIRLKIDNNNKYSLMTANACGYKWLISDYYIKYNPNKSIKFKKN